ncbi:thiol-disulfide oxidoreductase ResA [Salibacterium qingdaonense]|uniref:Peroxiredoxin n=1 Tax=Salibacterium qingdaonense TaxID=266892 RepID=A0A1I4Q2P1_9BACI|nr:thiol-disulfide oxidoreductase ResA [Salibacterium qingdaonense]SFM34327.1 Peroxiredoxin [Salibacterium qingdaonense]
MSKTKKRRLWMRTAVLLLFAGLAGFVVYQSISGESVVVEAGDKAPDFELETLEGETVRLSDYKGEGVFLNFWATYCKPCEEEMPYIERQSKIFEDRGVQVLAVNVGETEVTTRGFVERKNMTFPIPMDTGEALLNTYGIGPIPVTFLIDENGYVVDRITAGMSEQEINGYMERIVPEGEGD